jgi:hypothetical protein
MDKFLANAYNPKGRGHIVAKCGGFGSGRAT